MKIKKDEEYRVVDEIGQALIIEKKAKGIPQWKQIYVPISWLASSK